MIDVIQLLPDSIANQIAAGEVIQRPASAVKELLENAIDAGATNIKLILKEAGKTLIQVIDDGCGMSETDARLCFERHATSKIRTSDDLFNIRTMGFRGEALASIASIAQVELRTCRRIDEVGTKIVIEGFEFKGQEPCQTAVGTSFQVKNLFYNVPARRNFLKSNTVEMRHILDEFERVAIAHPHIFFTLNHNGQELFHLPSGNLRQRIVNVFGKETNKKLVPLNEDTDLIKINGFVGKPEFAKKTRGEQFFFVNNRFIKSQYLNHAVQMAFEDLLPKESYPSYWVFMDIDPKMIDINVHPTKQEIKFEDERMIYNYLKVSVRHALGQHAVTPTLDFETEQSFANAFPRLANRAGFSTTPSTRDSESISANFERTRNDLNFKKPSTLEKSNLEHWETLYEGLEESSSNNTPNNTLEIDENGTVALTFEQYLDALRNGSPETEPEEVAPAAPTFSTTASEFDDADAGFTKVHRTPYQIHNSYIVNHIKSGFLLIDQQAASERIVYEKYLAQMSNHQAATQTQLFPKTVSFSPSDAALLVQILPEINAMGFDVQAFGGTSFIVHGLPSDWTGKRDEQKILETLLEQFKTETDLKLDTTEKLARSLARTSAVKRGTPLSITEMEMLIDQLFACSMPFKSPHGRNCFITFDLEELAEKFLA